MEFLAYFAYILLAILILLMMITIHEFGHYISGKLLKFKINEFSIGFGPKLFSRKNKKTGEVFSVRAIPLGGFCAFEGEEGEAELEKNSTPKEVFSELKPEKHGNSTQLPAKIEQTQLKNFTDQPVWKRIVVLASGGIFNLISAVIFSFIFITAVGLETPHQTIDYVFTNESGIAYNELQQGDKIFKVDGKKLTYMYTLSDALSKTSETAVLTIERNGVVQEIEVKKQTIREQKDNKGILHKETYGFGIIRTAEREKSFITAIKYSVPYTLKMSWLVLGSLGKLITLQVPLGEIAGPIGTVATIAEYSILDARYILLLLPLLAANLGVFNLLPIPALDGSKIVFCAIEGIRKKPINRNTENTIHAVGLLLLFAFIVFIDIFGIFARCGL